jgi:hypothetical protein
LAPFCFRNIFSKTEERDGLLAGADEKILGFLEQCAEEKERGQRWSAVNSLVESLAGPDRTTGTYRLAHMRGVIRI